MITTLIIGNETAALAKIAELTAREEFAGLASIAESASLQSKLDIMLIQPADKKNSIGVDDFDQLASFAHTKPSLTPQSYVIVPKFELTTVQAQNKILKTVEEPPEYLQIFLWSRVLEPVLPTIISRCQVYQVGQGSAAGDEISELEKLARGSADGIVADPGKLYSELEPALQKLTDNSEKYLLLRLIAKEIDKLAEKSIAGDLNKAQKLHGLATTITKYSSNSVNLKLITDAIFVKLRQI